MTTTCSVKHFTGVTTTQGPLFLTAESKWHHRQCCHHVLWLAQIDKFKHNNLAGGDVIVEILYKSRQLCHAAFRLDFRLHHIFNFNCMYFEY